MSYIKNANEKIGQYAQRLMQTTGLGNAEILAQIKEQFPEAKTTTSCIAWYRSDLKKKPKVEVVQEVTMESINLEILEAETKLEALQQKLKDFMIENELKIEERKAALKAELEALEQATAE